MDRVKLKAVKAGDGPQLALWINPLTPENFGNPLAIDLTVQPETAATP